MSTPKAIVYVVSGSSGSSGAWSSISAFTQRVGAFSPRPPDRAGGFALWPALGVGPPRGPAPPFGRVPSRPPGGADGGADGGAAAGAMGGAAGGCLNLIGRPTTMSRSSTTLIADALGRPNPARPLRPSRFADFALRDGALCAA